MHWTRHCAPAPLMHHWPAPVMHMVKCQGMNVKHTALLALMFGTLCASCNREETPSATEIIVNRKVLRSRSNTDTNNLRIASFVETVGQGRLVAVEWRV